MKRLALPSLALMLIVSGSLCAQVPYNQGYQSFNQGYSPYNQGYSPYGNAYNTSPLRTTPYVGLLNPIGPGGAAVRLLGPVNNGLNIQGIQGTQSQFARALQSIGPGAPPPGAIEEDLYAQIPPAGHLSGFNNTLGYYPLNGRTTTTQNQANQPKKQ